MPRWYIEEVFPCFTEEALVPWHAAATGETGPALSPVSANRCVKAPVKLSTF
jgi:hypothetical protein